MFMGRLRTVPAWPDRAVVACGLQIGGAMDQLAAALALLSAQHDAIGGLLDELAISTDPARRTTAVMALADQLTLHLAAEQELLYPGAAAVISSEVLRELLTEHLEIKRVLADLLWLETDDSRFTVKLASLRRLVEMHEVWQESELFARVADGVDGVAGAMLAEQLRAWFDDASLVASAA